MFFEFHPIFCVFQHGDLSGVVGVEYDCGGLLSRFCLSDRYVTDSAGRRHVIEWTGGGWALFGQVELRPTVGHRMDVGGGGNGCVGKTGVRGGSAFPGRISGVGRVFLIAGGCGDCHGRYVRVV